MIFDTRRLRSVAWTDLRVGGAYIFSDLVWQCADFESSTPEVFVVLDRDSFGITRLWLDDDDGSKGVETVPFVTLIPRYLEFVS